MPLGCFIPKYIFSGNVVGYLDDKEKPHQACKNAEKIENKPQNGFKFIKCKAGYNSLNYNHRDTIIMEHPAGFQFSVGVPAFCRAIKESGMEASTGLLSKKIVLAWEKGNMEFLVEGTEKFNELVQKSEKIFDGTLQIPLAGLEAGKVYQRASGEYELYLGTAEVYHVVERVAKADEVGLQSDDKFWFLHKYNNWSGKNYIRKVSKRKKKLHFSVAVFLDGPIAVDADTFQSFSSTRNYVKAVGYHPDWKSILDFCLSAESRNAYYDSRIDPVVRCEYEEIDEESFKRFHPYSPYMRSIKFWRKKGNVFEEDSYSVSNVSEELWSDFVAGKEIVETGGFCGSRRSLREILAVHPYCRRYYTISGKLAYEEIPKKIVRANNEHAKLTIEAPKLF